LKRPVIVFWQLEAKLISLMAVQEIKQLRQAQEQRD